MKNKNAKALGKKPQVAIIMGSSTDHGPLKEAEEILAQFKVSTVTQVVSAHRTPADMVLFAKTAKEKGLKVIIAAAGGAAHLPGMVASLTTLPVIGVPILIPPMQGLDSLLSIVQMPKGIPVATVAINNGLNAGLLALQILAVSDAKIGKKLEAYRLTLKEKVKKQNLLLKKAKR